MSTPGIRHPLPAICGTWKLRSVEERSGGPMLGLQSSVALFHERGEGLYYIADSVFAGGDRSHVECSFRLDGQTYPITGSRFGDQVSVKQIAPETIEATMYSDGHLSATVRFTVRDEGAVLIADWTTVPAEGPPLTFSMISDRVTDV